MIGTLLLAMGCRQLPAESGGIDTPPIETAAIDTSNNDTSNNDTSPNDTAPIDVPPIDLMPTACGAISEDPGQPVLNLQVAPRNLLFITIDTLRRDRVGRYDPTSRTPFLDALLAESVVLDDIRSCSNWTLPGMTCIMTGQSTLDLGLEPMYVDPGVELLPTDLETLATWLSAAGWQSGLVSASSLFGEAYPVANGFQHYLGSDGEQATRLVDNALSLFDRLRPDQKWYFHIHFRDPHAPYDPPPEFQGDLAGQDLGALDPRDQDGINMIEWHHTEIAPEELGAVHDAVETLYRGEVEYLDVELARFWRSLEARGALEDTLVVFTADHGEQNFEHLNFMHTKSLHAEEAMIPGAFWAMGVEPAVFANPVNQADLAPTILDALGVEIPASVSGHIVGTEPSDTVRFSTSHDAHRHPIHSVDRNGLRLLYNWTGEWNFYRYRADPAEEQDQYDFHNENVRCLWDFLQPAIAGVDQKRAGELPVGPE